MATSDICMSSTQCFITSIGHTAPAMIPVRSVDRSRLGKVGVVLHSDEHRRHPVYTCAPFGFDCRKRQAGVESGCRNHHGDTVGGAAQVAHHHAEAVVERHRDAQPVTRRQLDLLGDEEAVVEDVAVRKRRPLRETRCPRGVLDVDRIGVGQARQPVGQLLAADPLGATAQLFPVVGPEEEHLLQRRAPRRGPLRPCSRNQRS